MKSLLVLALLLGSSAAFAAGAQSIDTTCLQDSDGGDVEIAICASVEARLDELCGADAGVPVSKECKVELYQLCKQSTRNISERYSCVDAIHLN